MTKSTRSFLVIISAILIVGLFGVLVSTVLLNRGQHQYEEGKSLRESKPVTDEPVTDESELAGHWYDFDYGPDASHILHIYVVHVNVPNAPSSWVLASQDGAYFMRVSDKLHYTYNVQTYLEESETGTHWYREDQFYKYEDDVLSRGLKTFKRNEPCPKCKKSVERLIARWAKHNPQD